MPTTHAVTPRASLGMGTATISGELTAAQDAPTTNNTDGISVSGLSQIAVGVHTVNTVTAWTCQLWVYDGTAWMQALDADGAAIAITGTTGTGAQVFNVAGFERAFFRLSAITGTSLKTTQRAIGPGL